MTKIKTPPTPLRIRKVKLDTGLTAKKRLELKKTLTKARTTEPSPDFFDFKKPSAELDDLGRYVERKPVRVRKPAVKKIVIDGKEVTLNGYFKVELGTYEILKHNVENIVNTLIVGPSGLGKTDIAVNLAKVLKVPITIFDMGTMTDPIMGLVGTHVIEVKGGKTYSKFAKSRFSEIIQKPGIVLLDEINRAAASANNLLFPCCDFRRELPMEYSFGDTRPIKVHPRCVFFATANIGSQFTGTHKLDRALVDRFHILAVDSLNDSQTISSMKVTHPKLSDTQVRTIVNIYMKINKDHDEFKIGFNLSFRHLKTAGTLTQNGFTIYDAYYSICKGLGGKDGLKAIEAILNSGK